MGTYYLIVNPLKREYLNPARFGEVFKFQGILCGPHCLLALKHLLSDCHGGRWVGDPVILAGDDGGMPNANGLVTATAEDPTRNLHEWAVSEFADISYRSLAKLCQSREIAEELASRAKEDASLLVDLGAVLEQYGPRPLEIALEQAVGRPWRKAYNTAVAHLPHWIPLPRVD